MKITMLAVATLALMCISCTRDYVCVCEAPAEDTTLTLTTEYTGLRKSEAEIEEENCEENSICFWDELR